MYISIRLPHVLANITDNDILIFNRLLVCKS